jgi:hypothetical protein
MISFVKILFLLEILHHKTLLIYKSLFPVGFIFLFLSEKLYVHEDSDFVIMFVYY